MSEENLTDRFLNHYQEMNSDELTTLIAQLQKKIEQLLKVPIKYPMRKLQMLSVLKFMRKNLDILTVLPTGYGKTIIAIICALYMKVSKNKKSILIASYKSLTAEHGETFNGYLKSIISDSDHEDVDLDSEWDLCILTPEKFDAMVCNSNKRDKLMQDVGLLIVDEVHILGERERGHRIENFLGVCKTLYDLRYVYLSATVQNKNEFASYLKASLIDSTPDDRPVKLIVEYYPYREAILPWGDSIPDQKANYAKRIEITRDITEKYPDDLFLIFCTSRARTRTVLCDLLDINSNTSLHDLIEQYNVAYHNAELDMSERQLVENAFKSKKLKIICATPTLAAGVNLPADHCILFDVEQYSVLKGSEIIDASRIQQQIGRAGRPNISKYGYAHIITPERIENEVRERVEIPTKVVSQLLPRLHEKILQWIGAGIANDLIGITEISRHLFAKFTDEDVANALEWLAKYEFARKTSSDDLSITKRGMMINYMYVQPENALEWKKQLESVVNAKDLREIFMRVALTEEYLSNLVVRKDDEKVISYAHSELGFNFPHVNLAENDCYSCVFRDKCHLNPETCGKFQMMSYEISDKLCKAFFLTFYDELAEKYLPRKYNSYTHEQEIKHLPISFGDRKILKDTGERMFNACSVIFYDNKEVQKVVKAMSVLAGAGTLQLELADLIGLKQVGLKRARDLLKGGIKTKSQFMASTVKEIADAMHCSERVAENIQQLNIETV